MSTRDDSMTGAAERRLVFTEGLVGGVDTHKDVHVAAVLDPLGRLLGTGEFPTTVAGYASMIGWMAGFGEVGTVGVEGTGCYGRAWPGTSARLAWRSWR